MVNFGIRVFPKGVFVHNSPSLLGEYQRFALRVPRNPLVVWLSDFWQHHQGGYFFGGLWYWFICCL